MFNECICSMDVYAAGHSLIFMISVQTTRSSESRLETTSNAYQLLVLSITIAYISVVIASLRS